MYPLIEVIPAQYVNEGIAFHQANGHPGTKFYARPRLAPDYRAHMRLAYADNPVFDRMSFVVIHVLLLSVNFFTENFFKLSTRVAGDILQKFVNYRTKFAIIGDFSCYTSKPLRDFIYESNRGREVFFVSIEDEAIARLTASH